MRINTVLDIANISNTIEATTKKNTLFEKDENLKFKSPVVKSVKK